MIRPATYAEVANRLTEPDAAWMQTPNFDLREFLAYAEAWTNGRDILLTETDAGRVEIHYLFRSRGKEALAAGVDFFRFLFQTQEACIIHGVVPAFNRAARSFSRLIGGTSAGITDTEFGPAETFSLTRRDFEARHGLPEIETAFHEHGTAVGERHFQAGG